ncbi:MAG: phosphodiester glycosidase family protein [Planctomycetota bacterium]
MTPRLLNQHRRAILLVWAVGLCWCATASGQTAATVAEAADRARQWIARPTTTEHIKAFAPAADIWYRQYATPRPLRVWITRINLQMPGVRLAVTEPLPEDQSGAGEEVRCANTLEFAQQRGVQLAINTSAFDPFRPRMGMPMDVVGLAAFRGRQYSEPDERFGALYVARDGRVALKGPPLPTADLWQVVPGFRLLLDDGQVAVAQSVANSKFGNLNPRTAVGIDREGYTLWLIVVDGRQAGVSAGITLVELACLFESLGVWDALNLDGGGSSTFVLQDAHGCSRVINTPVGRVTPHTLRQVVCNLGVYLPGPGLPVEQSQPKTLREAVVRLATQRRGGGFVLTGSGVSKTIHYDGQTLLHGNSKGTYCCGATLETFLDAYCLVHHGVDASAAPGRWFKNWPFEQIAALQQGWYGTPKSESDPLIPAEFRKTILERQVCNVLQWAKLGTPVTDYRLLRRGDFVQFWRQSGSGHSVIFWGRDRDKDGRERLWYWSSQRKPRYKYPQTAGDEPVALPGWGLNWEYVDDEIDPARIHGVSLKDAPAP